MPERAIWIAIGVAVVVNAAICAPLGFRRRWHPAIMGLGILFTAVLLSTAIVQAFSWRALYGFLMVLFPVHAVAFGALAVVRRKPRYFLIIVTFCALTAVAVIRFNGVEAPRLIVGLRAIALAFTAASVAAVVRGRRRDPVAAEQPAV